MKRLICFLVLFSTAYLAAAQTGSEQRKATDALIRRVVKGKAVHFKTEILPYKEDGKDYFQIAGSGKKIVLRGTNGVSLASAFNYYLRHVAKCQVSWNGSNLQLPTPLPVPQTTITRNTAYDKRYYLNYCTFSYTMSWWDWERWEREIDWMAMNGINMPLAVTGQNEILYRVYQSFGLSEKDLAGFFSGPAYFAWFWMGNLDGWGGPLPRSWMKSHEALQKKILARQRSLGMKPVLPAFTGHVPASFRQRFPGAKVHRVNWGEKFPDVYVLDPADSLFLQIGKRFIEEQTKTFGTDHFYSADTFNEVDPPTNDSLFIDRISKKVYESMAAADPKAVWVMQGWLFYFSARFWKQPQIKALLNAIPNDRMIVLDLWSERKPIWQQTEAYYGKPWIWSMLHNFGGNTSLFGQMDRIAQHPSRDLNNPRSGNLAGLGLTMEGIEQNPVIYELMQENIWTRQPIAIEEWLKSYARRRYGKSNRHADSAWQILRATVYADTLSSGGPKSIVQARPTFANREKRVVTSFGYRNSDLAKAWRHLVLASPELGSADGFRFDLVDVSRQVLANHALAVQNRWVRAYQQRDLDRFRRHTKEFLVLIEEMDELVGTRREFLLGTWLESAKRWGTNPSEKALYERNARNLITTWGDKNSGLNEYAARQWSGLFSGFYKPRWEQFFALVEADLAGGKKFDPKEFSQQVRDWEWAWVNRQDRYPVKPAGNPVTVARRLYEKYYPEVLTAGENRGRPGDHSDLR